MVSLSGFFWNQKLKNMYIWDEKKKKKRIHYTKPPARNSDAGKLVFLSRVWEADIA